MHIILQYYGFYHFLLLAGSDYNPDPVDAVFPAGQTSTTAQIPIRMDNEAEDDEQFDLTIKVPSEVEMLVELGPLSNAVGIIKDSSGLDVIQPYKF